MISFEFNKDNPNRIKIKTGIYNVGTTKPVKVKKIII